MGSGDIMSAAIFESLYLFLMALSICSPFIIIDIINNDLFLSNPQYLPPKYPKHSILYSHSIFVFSSLLFTFIQYIIPDNQTIWKSFFFFLTLFRYMWSFLNLNTLLWHLIDILITVPKNNPIGRLHRRPINIINQRQHLNQLHPIIRRLDNIIPKQGYLKHNPIYTVVNFWLWTNALSSPTLSILLVVKYNASSYDNV